MPAPSEAAARRFEVPAVLGANHHEVTGNRHRIDTTVQQELKDHVRTVAEPNLHCREIVFPHAAEPFAGNSCAARPASRSRPTTGGGKKYGGLMPSEMKRLKLLEEENTRLKKLVADLSLDKAMLQDVVKRKL